MIDPIALAQDLINCPSVTPKNAGVIEVLERALTALGFRVWRQTFQQDGTEAVENLYARYGDTAPNLCFAGHLDVVPAGDTAAWRTDPFAATITDGILYGRGAEDMKGAIACFVAAAAQCIEAAKKSPLGGSISLLITLDEEGPGINGTKPMLAWLKARDEIPDICLVGEPTNPTELGQMIKIGRRGSMNNTLTVRGKQGHVAYPELAENPVTKLVHILHRFTSEALDDGTPYFPPSNLEVTSIDVDNPVDNLIPAQGSAKFNIRFNDSHPAQHIKDRLHRICQEEAPESYTLDLRVSGEAFHTSPNRLTDILQQSCQKITGQTPELSTTGGTSDARFIKDYCPVVEFGTTGRTPHQIDENVSVKVLHQLTELYAETLRHYFA